LPPCRELRVVAACFGSMNDAWRQDRSWLRLQARRTWCLMANIRSRPASSGVDEPIDVEGRPLGVEEQEGLRTLLACIGDACEELLVEVGLVVRVERDAVAVAEFGQLVEDLAEEGLVHAGEAPRIIVDVHRAERAGVVAALDRLDLDALEQLALPVEARQSADADGEQAQREPPADDSVQILAQATLEALFGVVRAVDADFGHAGAPSRAACSRTVRVRFAASFHENLFRCS